MDKKKESFWSQYFRTLKRNKVIAAATFSAVVGSFGIAALRQPPPPPAYAAEGVLVDNAPVVSVSETSLKIHEQGKGIISKDLLLSDILLKATSEKLREKSIRFTSGQLLDNTSVSIET
ncbi:MAG: cobalamin biosynthesis protein CobQ, partial [Cyanobacteria bacterium J06560_2]